MRTLFAVFLFALGSLSAQAAAPVYEFYVLACDAISDCRQIASISLAADGQVEEPATPGIAIRIAAPARESGAVRLSVNLEPARLFAASSAPSPGPVSLQFHTSSLRLGYFSPIAVFGSDGKIYQLWGKLTVPPTEARQVALK
ncbi:MAG: hypothetical protein CVU34_18550 [Betaproteobacteria bacterium HGW-Betaproteobacteria-7]|jgi:hypothetical protein|nr:MAG: hypothetical protein CVU34_18550 [Betaproteobacteria bacterium HGW-Betaproteobacteria-7]